MPARLRLTAALVALVAAASLGPVVPPADAAVSAELVFARTGFGIVRESSPTPLDIDNDGRLDIAFGSRDGNVWVLRPDGTNAPGWPRSAGAPIDSSVSAADADGDLRPELFVGSGTYEAPGGALLSFQHDGTTRFRFVARDNTFEAPSVHTTPALADVAGGAGLDVTFGTLAVQSIWSLSQAGTVHAGFPFYADDTVFSSPAVVDVNGDGRRDFVIGGDASAGVTPNPVNFAGGLVRAIDGSGRELWQHRMDDIIRSPISVGDIDGDGAPEVVVGGGDYYGGDDSLKVWAFDLAGRVKPGWPVTTDGVPIAEPALADLDGDGTLDVAIGTFTSTHGRGDGGSVYALDGAGRDLPGYPRPSGGGVVVGGIVTADLDGDGAQDPIVPTGGGLYAYSGRDGAPLLALAVGQTTFHNSGLVTDLDGDGRLDLVAVGANADGGVAYRWRLDGTARLGERGWHQYRKDHHKTGSWVPAIAPSRALGFDRIAGADRYDTARLVAAAARPGGAPTAVVATGQVFADALAGGPTAAALGGAVLLTARDDLPSATAAALEDLGPSRVLVLGGPSAVSAAVLEQIEDVTGVVPGRVAGDDRFGTAAAASQLAFPDGAADAYLASGADFADALGAGAAAAQRRAPLLLAGRDALPTATATELDRLDPDRIIVVGGPSAIGPGVLAELRRRAEVVVLAGTDRYSTAAAVSAHAQADGARSVLFATGLGFPDALAAAVLSAVRSAPVLLVPRGCVTNAARAEVDRLDAQRAVLVGGTAALSSAAASLAHCG